MEYRFGGVEVLLNVADNQKINNSWVLLYVREGVGMYDCSGRLRCLDEGELIYFPPGSQIAFDSVSLGDEYNATLNAAVIRFDEQWLEGFLRLFPTLSDIVLALKEHRNPSRIIGTKWLKISNLMDRLMTCKPQKQIVVLLEIFEHLAGFSDMVPIASSAMPVIDAVGKVERIDRFISCNLTRKFTLDEIAEYAGMNKTYFCLFFKKHYGISLTDHVNNKRIDMACTMLRQGNVQISDIARTCGFPTVTYFNRVFKKIKGISPRELQ